MTTQPNQARSRDELIQCHQSGNHFKYLAFWGHQPKTKNIADKSCLSNWFPAPFTIDGVTYPTSEHHMMAQKALLFGDQDIFEQIVAADSPGKVKSLGRKVKNFSDDLWVRKRFEIVLEGNLAKFSQNPALMTFLLSTKNCVIIEASPLDKVWGVGLAADDPKIENPTLWEGENLLGFVLMETRERILQQSVMH